VARRGTRISMLRQSASAPDHATLPSRNAAIEDTKHYHRERNHQRLENEVTQKAGDLPSTADAVE